jgi:hypothetical protein
MTRVPRWLPSVVLVAVLAAAAAITVTQVSFVRTIVLGSIARGLLHPPSDRDEFFFLVAVDFEQPALCDRIDGRADGSTGGGWGGEFKIRRLRSVCRSRLAERDRLRAEVPPSMPALVAQIRALGYTDADVAEAAYAENNLLTPVYAVYQNLLADDEFRSRLRGAASYAEPRDAAGLRPAHRAEFLYQMVAIDATEAALCSRISPNAKFTDETGATALLQSQCYQSIAWSTRDSRLCEPLPAASFPYVNERFATRESCQRIAEIYRRSVVKDTLTNGPTPLPHAADLLLALGDIGYGADALPPIPKPTDDDYWEFVSRLIFRGPADARAEFLRRVAALK